MIQKTIAVVGGGISSLSFALNLAQRIDLKGGIVKIKVFEKNFKLGGRIQAYQSPKDEGNHTFYADVGANFIDYDNQQEKEFIQGNIPQNLIKKFKSFDGKFMLYENQKVSQPQAQKTRYFYEGGFNHMVDDWKKQIQIQKALSFSVSQMEVQKVQKQKGQWRVRSSGQKQINQDQLFDILVFGTPAPQSKCIIQKSHLQRGKDLIEQLGRVKYTKQLSVIFQVQQQEQVKSENSPYCILFKGSKLTFMCFHQQKYPTNQINIGVIQTNQELTQKYSVRLSSPQKQLQLNSLNQIQKEIAQQIWGIIPKQVKEKYKLINKCLGVHYWPQSLIKPIPEVKSKQELFERFNNELNKQFKNESNQNNLYFTGDYLNNKSRVTGAIAVGIKLSQQILKEHFKIDAKSHL